MGGGHFDFSTTASLTDSEYCFDTWQVESGFVRLREKREMTNPSPLPSTPAPDDQLDDNYLTAKGREYAGRPSDT